MHEIAVCPGCKRTELSGQMVLRSQPVILNYRFATPDEARKVSRRDIKLRECENCGLIFNAIFEEAVVPYDERYENRQSCSQIFKDMMENTARNLAARYPLGRGDIVEIGCGKGEFLRLLCKQTGARGVGFDTSCEEVGTGHDNPRFIRRYADESDVGGPVDAIICRHVVEHVPEIGKFLALLAGMARRGGSPVIYIETPRWEWIAEHGAFWDIFYEHCNYFSMASLRHLAALVGLQTLAHYEIFGGQYQALELRYLEGARPSRGVDRTVAGSLTAFADGVERRRAELQERLIAKGAATGWAIWGAGAKGVSFAGSLEGMAPRFVVDSNPAKQGTYIPGTMIPVVSPDDPRVEAVTVMLIANDNYQEEISQTLKSRNFKGNVILP